MKKILAMLLCMALLFACIPAQAATVTTGKVLWRPEQSFALAMYASAIVARVPDTSILSFKADSTGVVWTNLNGYVTADKVGTGTALLVEYDRAKNITYKTTVRVTVKASEPQVTWVNDNGINSDYVQNYITLNGWVFPVGMQVSCRKRCFVNGVEQQVLYLSSATDVVTVDATGLLTMKGAGSAMITASCKGYPQFAQVLNLSVYSENSGGSMNAVFSPSDPSVRANVYEKADDTSAVLFQLTKGDAVTLLAKNSTWCRISLNSRTGYVKTSVLTMTGDYAYTSPTLTEGTTTPTDPGETAFAAFKVGSTVYLTNNQYGQLYYQANAASAVLANIPYGQALTVLEMTSDFAKTTYAGQTGYVSLSLLSGEKPVEVTDDRTFNLPCTLYVQADALSTDLYAGALELYLSASYTSMILDTYATDTAVYVTEITADKKWARVQVGGHTGYMPLAFLSAVAPEKPITDGSTGVIARRVIATGNAGNLYLRAAASTSAEALGSYPNGTMVDIHYLSNNGWARVTVGGKKGYMQLSFLAELPEDATDPSATMIVATGNVGKLNMRSAPTSGNNIIGQFDNGTRVTVLSKGTPWSHVQINGITGYVMTQFLAAAPEPTATPEPTPTLAPGETAAPTPTPVPTAAPVIKYVQTGNTGRLYLRSTPVAGNNIVGRFDNGTAVTVQSEANGWSRVTVGSLSGYMMSKFLTSAAPATPAPIEGKTMYVQTGNEGRLNLRASPATGNNVLGKLDNGTAVTVLSATGDWAMVNVNGMVGYVQRQFLTEGAPATPAPGTPTATPVPGKTMYVQTGNEGRLNLRNRPDGSVIGKLNNGTAVTVYAIANGWANVMAGGMPGYVQSKFLTDAAPATPAPTTPGAATPTPAPASSTMYVQTGNEGRLNLRNSPDGSVIGKLNNGTAVTVYAIVNDWANVMANGVPGYVQSRFLTNVSPATPAPTVPGAATPTASPTPQPSSFAPGSSATVTQPHGEYVNLRQGDSADTPSLAQVPSGSTVEIVSYGPYWSKVRYNGQEGYMVSKYLK